MVGSDEELKDFVLITGNAIEYMILTVSLAVYIPFTLFLHSLFRIS